MYDTSIENGQAEARTLGERLIALATLVDAKPPVSSLGEPA